MMIAARVGLVVLTVAYLGVASVAHSETAAAPPKFSELPQGRMSVPPPLAGWPTSIPSSESVPGFFIVPQRAFPTPPRATPSTSGFKRAFVQKPSTGKKAREPSVMGSSMGTSTMASQPLIIVGSASDAEQHRTGTAQEDLTGCYGQHALTTSLGTSGSVPRPPTNEWANLTSQISIHGRSEAVVALHAERLVEDGSAARLESTDAWLDTATRGMRLIGKTSLPLRHVASEPGGFEVYVGRDERTDGKRLVQFVIHRRKGAIQNPTQTFGVLGRGLFGSRIDGKQAAITTSGCGHIRVPLAAASGSAENAVIQLAAALPPRDTDAPPDSKDKDIRTRQLHFQFAVSQLASEREPLVGVSASWAGREVVTPRPATSAVGSSFDVGF